MLAAAKSQMKREPVIRVHEPSKEWTLTDEEMRALYCRSKIVLALSHNGPFGLVPLEAMACGTPVIAVNEGGYRETIQDGETGYLIQRYAKELAAKGDLLLSRPDLRKSMGARGVRIVKEKWDWDVRVTTIGEGLHGSISDVPYWDEFTH